MGTFVLEKGDNNLNVLFFNFWVSVKAFLYMVLD